MIFDFSTPFFRQFYRFENLGLGLAFFGVTNAGESWRAHFPLISPCPALVQRIIAILQNRFSGGCQGFPAVRRGLSMCHFARLSRAFTPCGRLTPPSPHLRWVVVRVLSVTYCSHTP
jgi:hypothetical protein